MAFLSEGTYVSFGILWTWKCTSHVVSHIFSIYLNILFNSFPTSLKLPATTSIFKKMSWPPEYFAVLISEHVIYMYQNKEQTLCFKKRCIPASCIFFHQHLHVGKNKNRVFVSNNFWIRLRMMIKQSRLLPSTSPKLTQSYTTSWIDISFSNIWQFWFAV